MYKSLMNGEETIALVSIVKVFSELEMIEESNKFFKQA